MTFEYFTFILEKNCEHQDFWIPAGLLPCDCRRSRSFLFTFNKKYTPETGREKNEGVSFFYLIDYRRTIIIIRLQNMM